VPARTHPRPVLMTAATAMPGLIPLAPRGTEFGGMGLSAPLDKALMGSPALSTLLTQGHGQMEHTDLTDQVTAGSFPGHICPRQIGGCPEGSALWWFLRIPGTRVTESVKRSG